MVLPKLLFLSGMHGDEYVSGQILTSLLQNDHFIKSPFVHIPQVSPSAVAAGTRKNAYGHDINRQFINNIKDPEANSLVKVVSLYSFTTVIDVHEDPDRTNEFYLYDSQRMGQAELVQYRNIIRQSGMNLFTGLDDPSDTHLCCQIDHGYYYFRSLQNTEGFFSKWALGNGIGKRVFTVEVPGKALLDKKRKILEAIVPFLISL